MLLADAWGTMEPQSLTIFEKVLGTALFVLSIAMFAPLLMP